MKHIAILSTLVFLVQTAVAQISVQLKPRHDEFVAYEAVAMTVTITNRAGRPIQFANKLNRNWIEFIVTNRNGRSIAPRKRTIYKPLLVQTGSSVSSTFVINQSFDLTLAGNYSIYAIVRMPGQGENEGTRSKTQHFTVFNGHAAWKQRAGVPGTKEETREYRLINVNRDKTSDLYVQVEDVKRGRMLATYSMGKNLGFKRYQATMDRANNLHVLFQTTPSVYSHTVVNPDGKTIRRLYHKRGRGGTNPKLITTSTGTVGVGGSTPYDPAKEAEKRRQIHNLSELPIGL